METEAAVTASSITRDPVAGIFSFAREDVQNPRRRGIKAFFLFPLFLYFPSLPLLRREAIAAGKAKKRNGI